jgi:hypothetical protein
MIPDRFSAQACSQNSAVEPNSLMMPTGAIATAHYAGSSELSVTTRSNDLLALRYSRQTKALHIVLAILGVPEGINLTKPLDSEVWFQRQQLGDI